MELFIPAIILAFLAMLAVAYFFVRRGSIGSGPQPDDLGRPRE